VAQPLKWNEISGKDTARLAAFQAKIEGRVGARKAANINIAKREDLEWRSANLFAWIADGSLKIRVDQTYPLADAARAQEDLEGRKTTGKLLLKA